MKFNKIRSIFTFNIPWLTDATWGFPSTSRCRGDWPQEFSGRAVEITDSQLQPTWADCCKIVFFFFLQGFNILTSKCCSCFHLWGWFYRIFLLFRSNNDSSPLRIIQHKRIIVKEITIYLICEVDFTEVYVYILFDIVNWN